MFINDCIIADGIAVFDCTENQLLPYNIIRCQIDNEN